MALYFSVAEPNGKPSEGCFILINHARVQPGLLCNWSNASPLSKEYSCIIPYCEHFSIILPGKKAQGSPCFS